MKINNKNVVIPILLFVVFFLSVPMWQLQGLKMMPGDIGDARLNNYFLENIYQFLIGKSDSLWHLGFFYPFQYVIGFSDNHFGSAPIYLLARVMTGESDTAFQIWYLMGYAINFGAAYFSLRRLGGSQLASTVGSLIFAFALPTTAHAGHTQLHYRFGVPLSITFFVLFLQQKEYHLLTKAGLWLVWQFYSGIYMGFFTLLFIAIGLIAHFIYNQTHNDVSFTQSLKEFLTKWYDQSRYEKLKVLVFMTMLLTALCWLFYPYIQVSQMYGFKRTWGEIELMLPRPQSYLLSDASYFWSSPESKMFSDIPMRHEHQMFIGFIPLILALISFIIGTRDKNGHIYTSMVWMCGGIVLVTLDIGGFSLWYLLHKLPLFSSIRAMTRFDQVLLFPVAYFSVVTIDYLRNYYQWAAKLIAVVIVPLMMFEFSATSMNVSLKEEWRSRLSKKEVLVSEQLSEDSILFFAQNGLFYAEDIDAMWVSLNLGLKTLNGYSGNFPPEYSIRYNNDCSELPKRVISYLQFSNQLNDKDAYFDLMKRIVPIGFHGCDPNWLEFPPSFTEIDRQYTKEEINNLSYRFEGKEQIFDQTVVHLKILNSNDIPISARSLIGRPVRISWRFLDASGKPVSGWDNRKELVFDIPANGYSDIWIPIDHKIEIKGGTLQISLVQELVFWAHDIGVKPLEIPWE